MKSALINLQKLGYEIVIVDNDIKLTFKGKNKPDKSAVISLVEKVKADKQETVRILEEQSEKSLSSLFSVNNSKLDNKKNRLTQQVSPSSIAKMDAIRDQALSLGWREEMLYQSHGRFRFPCGDDYGLVCFVDEHRCIGKVTRPFIEIVGPPPRNIIHRFHNPDVDQPWCKKAKNV